MNLQRANYTERDPVTLTEPVNLLDHEMVLTSSRQSATVRIHGKGRSALHISVPADRALRIGEAFIRAALRLDPSLRAQVQAFLAKIGEGA